MSKKEIDKAFPDEDIFWWDTDVKALQVVRDALEKAEKELNIWSEGESSGYEYWFMDADTNKVVAKEDMGAWDETITELVFYRSNSPEELTQEYKKYLEELIEDFEEDEEDEE